MKVRIWGDFKESGCRHVVAAASSLVLWAVHLEVFLTAAAVAFHLLAILAYRIAAASESLPRRSCMSTLMLVVKVGLYFLVGYKGFFVPASSEGFLRSLSFSSAFVR